jgi:alpha-methylacyl-CoA racemase
MNTFKSVKVLDFTRLLPGPLATKMLADMGFSVTKIESPKRLDYAKFTLEETFYNYLNGAKESLIFDYEAEPERIQQLIQEHDVVIEQFRPGAMHSWGLGFEQVTKINPEIIYVSLTGYGQQGELKNMAGHDLNYVAQAGLLKHFKDENGHPVIPGIQIGDVVGGSYTSVIKILSAVLSKKMGQSGAIYIDVSITDSIKELTYIADKINTVPLTPIADILSGGMVNYNVYECADKQWIAFGALEEKFWKKFALTIGRNEWAELNMFQLHKSVFDKKQLEAVFKTQPAQDWEKLGKQQDICITKI